MIPKMVKRGFIRNQIGSKNGKHYDSKKKPISSVFSNENHILVTPDGIVIGAFSFTRINLEH